MFLVWCSCIGPITIKGKSVSKQQYMSSMQCKKKIQNIGKSKVFSSSQSAVQPLDKIGFQICVSNRRYHYVVFAKSAYLGHRQDHELVSLTAKGHNGGDLFISSICFLIIIYFLQGINVQFIIGVSVIAKYLQDKN